MSRPLPILVGCGQRTIRSKSLKDFIHPIDAMAHVVESAAEDAGTRALIEKVDSLHVVNVLSWSLADAPSMLAEVLGAHPKTKEYSATGGNTPQFLVSRTADALVEGRSEIAIIAGCEVMRSVGRAVAQGRDLGFFKHPPQIPLTGLHRLGVTPIERAHQADRPLRLYPLLDNALRAKDGWTLERQRESLGKFAKTYSAVAAKNSDAALPFERTAEEVVTTSEKNRMIGYPYTKYLCAMNAVDQAGALIMTTDVVAKRLGIPRDKWIYIHGGQDAHDRWFVSERADLADSPAIAAVVQDALHQAGLGLDQIACFDFYSCFAFMPRISRRVLGISEDDPRPMTLTGGLPYFGGPGNNYVTHALCSMMMTCRSNPSSFAMVTSNGYYCTKHGVGIYGAAEPQTPWSRKPWEEFQAELVLPPALEVDPEPSGDVTVEGYTVWHSRDGDPLFGILCGRTTEGKRAWAQTRHDDPDLLDAMMSEEWVGKTGRIAGREGEVNFIEFG